MTNLVNPPYGVNDVIQPVISADRSYPLNYKYNFITGTQLGAGPADLTLQLGPLQGKSWLVDAISVQYSNARAGQRMRVTIAQFPSGAGGLQPIFSLQTASFATGAPFPLFGGGACAAGVSTAGPLTTGPIYLVGVPPTTTLPSGTATCSAEHLMLVLDQTLLNDTAELRVRYLEQDLDFPPGG